MVSYAFTGFLQQGLTYWLEQPRFPESVADLTTNDSGRVLFEVMFMIVTSSFVISIITGIICDTFGELRMAQDEAQNYRATTCFGKEPRPFAPFMYINASFYQDRLGTNIGKALKKRTRFCSDQHLVRDGEPDDDAILPWIPLIFLDEKTATNDHLPRQAWDRAFI
jgi:hypothetical protein|eukprot:COSAG06_NODE_1332_length_9842_cov_155.567074_4_plen_166_part_00